MAYNATLAAEPHVRKALEAVGATAGCGAIQPGKQRPKA
jgi:hypothetical protein